MLAIRKASTVDKSSINILPCRINHDGPTKVTKRYWGPRNENDGSKTAHFRGRRLRARVVKIPEGYEGLVLKSTDRILVEPVQPLEPQSEDDDEPEELPEPVKIAEHVSTFDEMTIWGHDQVPTADDSFAKGVEEWITFAEAIHKT